MAEFNRELRYSVHKVHLLCLLAHGIRLSKSCDDPVVKSVLLSLLRRELVRQESEAYGHELLLELLKWFKAESSGLVKRVEGICPSDRLGLTSVQLLVALLRSLGLRTRLVLVLSPASHRPNRKGGAVTPVSAKGVSRLNRKVSSAGKSTCATVTVSEREQCESSGLEKMATAVASTSRGAPGERGGQKETPPVGSQRKRSLKNESPVSSDHTCSDNSPSTGSCQTTSVATTSGRHQTVSRSGARRGRKRTTTACKDSPYFSQGGKRRRKSKGSLKDEREYSPDDKDSDLDDSDYDPQSEKQTKPKELGEEEYGDLKEIRPGKRKAKGKKTKTVKVSPVAKRMKTEDERDEQDGNVCEEVPENIHPTADEEREGGEGECESEEASCSPSQSLYDNTTSWAEVYVQTKQQWASLHIPSCSVGHPKLCEKHCCVPLSYVIGVESGT